MSAPGRPFPMEVTPAEARRMTSAAADDRALLLDCRTPAEHATARIEGALLLPLDQLGARAGELEPHEDRAIVVYCHHGVRSLRAAAILRAAGFERVTSMAGGIDRWSLEIDPSVPRY